MTTEEEVRAIVRDLVWKPPDKSYSYYDTTNRENEAVAALMRLMGQIENPLVEFLPDPKIEDCPHSKDGHGHCVHWWDGDKPCCWCTRGGCEPPDTGTPIKTQIDVLELVDKIFPAGGVTQAALETLRWVRGLQVKGDSVGLRK